MTRLNKNHQRIISGTGMMALLFCGMPSPKADVPMPTLSQAKGEQCVEETAFMRRNHMDILQHQRDKTMRQGIRTKKHSLHGCLECHAVYDEHQQIVDSKHDKHFCNSCHSYAAVKIDCFDCHASTPQLKEPAEGI